MVLYIMHTAHKMKFSIKDFSSKCDQNLQFPVDVVVPQDCPTYY